MSEPIFEQCVDERGNISVRVSRDVQVLTREEANLIEAEYKRMQAENAKLRDERREYQATIDSLVDECADHKAENDRLWEYIAHKRLLQDFARLVDENSKLRKLVRDMWEGYNDPRCEECHLKDTPTCADCPICAREASVIDRMRELGVEVDA